MRLAAAAGAAVTTPIAANPVTWDFFGYPYHPGPVLTAIFAVAVTRAIVFLQTTGRKQVVLDVFVSVLCAMVAVLWTQANSLDPLRAGLTGIGAAGIGIGFIAIAKTQMTSTFKEVIRAAARAALKGLDGADPKG